MDRGLAIFLDCSGSFQAAEKKELLNHIIGIIRNKEDWIPNELLNDVEFSLYAVNNGIQKIAFDRELLNEEMFKGIFNADLFLKVIDSEIPLSYPVIFFSDGHYRSHPLNLMTNAFQNIERSFFTVGLGYDANYSFLRMFSQSSNVFKTEEFSTAIKIALQLISKDELLPSSPEDLCFPDETESKNNNSVCSNEEGVF